MTDETSFAFLFERPLFRSTITWGVRRLRREIWCGTAKQSALASALASGMRFTQILCSVWTPGVQFTCLHIDGAIWDNKVPGIPVRGWQIRKTWVFLEWQLVSWLGIFRVFKFHKIHIWQLHCTCHFFHSSSHCLCPADLFQFTEVQYRSVTTPILVQFFLFVKDVHKILFPKKIIETTSYIFSLLAVSKLLSSLRKCSAFLLKSTVL